MGHGPELLLLTQSYAYQQRLFLNLVFKKWCGRESGLRSKQAQTLARTLVDARG